MARGPSQLSPTEWARLDRLLDEALSRTGEDRQSYLASLSATDREAIGTLLAHAEAASGAGALGNTVRLTQRVGPGTVLGRWRLEALIGTGGSSMVFAARHIDDDVPIHAALKLLQRSDAGAFAARFQREREILVTLDHPNIVRLLDGGRAPDGAPYYVMEHIHGQTLLRWGAGQPRAARIRALIQICDAVEAAHQRLIVHCDLKPDNILVDDQGRPQVLDFGIARLRDDAEVTATGMRMMTPRWAAPEQVSGAAVTTQTDVHALGLLLIALLTDQSPRRQRSGPALLAEILDGHLEPPSAFDAGSRGDLDAICLKATAMSPTSRYASAAALAADLRRHLAGEAILARRDARWYRAARFIQQNRWPVAAAVAVVLTLVGWAGSANLAAQRLVVERDRAEQAAQRAEANTELLVRIFEAADPNHSPAKPLMVADVLDTSRQELERQTIDEETRAEMMLTLGRVQFAAHTPDAYQTLSEAHDLFIELYDPDHPQVWAARHYRNTAGFPTDFEAALDDQDALIASMRTQRPTMLMGEALLSAAIGHAERGDLSGAATLAKEAESTLIAFNPSRAARAKAAHGFILCAEKQTEAGKALLSDALQETEDALGTRLHADYFEILHELIMCHGNDAGIAHLHLEGIALRRKVHGDSFGLASALNNYALYIEAYDLQASIDASREAVEVLVRLDHATSASSQSMIANYGLILQAADRLQEGADLLRPLCQMPDPKASLVRMCAAL